MIDDIELNGSKTHVAATPLVVVFLRQSKYNKLDGKDANICQILQQYLRIWTEYTGNSC